MSTVNGSAGGRANVAVPRRTRTASRFPVSLRMYMARARRADSAPYDHGSRPMPAAQDFTRRLCCRAVGGFECPLVRAAKRWSRGFFAELSIRDRQAEKK